MRRSQCSGLAPSLTWCSRAGCAMVDRWGALRVLRVTVRHFWRIKEKTWEDSMHCQHSFWIGEMDAWSHLQFLYRLKFLQISKDHETSVPQVVPELLQTAPAPFYIIITGYLKAAQKESIQYGLLTRKDDVWKPSCENCILQGSKGDPVIRKVVSDLLVAGSVSPLCVPQTEIA